MPSVHPSKSSADPTDTILVTDASGNIFNVPASALGGQSTGGYVAPPVDSNSSGEAGQYSWDADYFYICIAEDSWDRFPVSRAGWNTAMPDNAVILSSSTSTDGDELTIVFDRAMSKGAGYQDSDFNLDIIGGSTDIGLTYVSGSGTDTWVFSIATVIRKNETVDLDYNGRPDGIEDASGNDLAEVIDMTVTNNSENTGESYDDILFWDGFDGIIDGTTYTSSIDDYPVAHAGTLSGTYYTYIAMNTATKKAGEKSVHFPDYSNYDCAVTFDLDGKPTNHNGRFGFWFNYSSPYIAYAKQFATLRESSISTSTRFIVAGVDASNPPTRIRVFYYFGNTQYVARLITLNPTTFKDLWLFLEVAWSPSQMNVYMDGVLIDTYEYVFSGFTETSLAQFVLGGTPTGMYVDNLIISTDPDRDLYALALLEACPRTE